MRADNWLVGALTAHYQPIVSLTDGAIVGYEALAREDGAFPAARFAAARAAGGLGELDLACMKAALSGARGLNSTLFVNVEPECFDGPPPGDAPDRVVVELTERGLTTRPAELLLAVERVRDRGWGIAVDDVGADWRSLALLPFLRPDVVKLDRGVLADGATAEAARVVRGARAHVERHGGLLLAEGIEDAEHERIAAAFGATLGQGWRFGRPAPEPSGGSDGAPLEIVQPLRPIGHRTPFEVLVASGVARGVGTKGELLPLSIDLEREAAATRDPAVVLATFQRAEHFTPGTRRRYADLTRGAAFVAAFGTGMSPEPAPGVRGARLADGERLRDEWTVIVVGPHSALALIARDLGDGGKDMERRFEYALTEDRELVLRAGRALMLRVAAEPGARPSFRARLGSFDVGAPASSSVSVAGR